MRQSALLSGILGNIKKFIENYALKRSKEIIRFHKESDFSFISLCVKCRVLGHDKTSRHSLWTFYYTAINFLNYVLKSFVVYGIMIIRHRGVKMKKIKNLLTILLTLILIFSACLLLTGCNIEPYYFDTWYLVFYSDENGEKHYAGYDTIKQEILYSDDITIRYFEDGTFIFKEFDKEYTGTYSYKNGKKETSVFLTFSDGMKGDGTCAEYMFDGAWYEGTLQAFGKKYTFTERWQEENMDERFDFPYTHVEKIIAEMQKSGKSELHDFYHSESYTLYKGQIKFRNGEYFFVPYNSKAGEKNLSQAYKLFTYEVAEDGSAQRGDNVLREGKCFINYNEYRVRLDSENIETRSEYAVWYYQDFFGKLFPHSDLDLEDILSVRADRLDRSSDSYTTRIWKQGSKELKDFYELCSAQYVVPKTEPSETEQDSSDQTTFYIKTTEQTYKVIFNFYFFDDRGSTADCVVDGKYYQNLSNSRLSLIPRGEYYLSFKTEPGDARFFIGEHYVKTYDDLFDNILFTYDRDFNGKKTSKYILKVGNHTLILLDKNHFLWQVRPNINICCEIVGDIDFSKIFEEYPMAE